jgi:hypothetical protein
MKKPLPRREFATPRQKIAIIYDSVQHIISWVNFCAAAHEYERA